MSHTTVVEPGRVQSWIRRTIKQQALECTFDQLSNRSSHLTPADEHSSKKIPTTVINKVSDKFNRGVMSTTAMWIGKPQMAVVGGPNTAEGNERKATTKIIRVFYNNQRFPLVLGDESVAGDAMEFYQAAEDTSLMIEDLFAEQADYDYFHAACEGGDPQLVNSSFWEDSDKGSEITTPMSKTIHPNIWCDSSGTKVTYHQTYSTFETSLQTAATALANTHIMSIAALDKIWLKCIRTLVPVRDASFRTQGIKWVVMMSDASYQQLVTSTTANASMRDMFKHTKGGLEKIISGSFGVYRNMLLIVAPRQPIYDLTQDAGSRFRYVTPLADNRTRTETTNASTADGSAEITLVMGNGALQHATVKEMDYKRKGFDYDFSEGMCGQKACGTVRSDIDLTVAASASRKNESSLLYLTASTSAVI